GLFCTGQPRVMIRPNVGMQHTWAIMRALTSVQPGEGTPLSAALEEWSRLASRDSSLAVITPATTQDWLSPLTRVAARGLVASVTLLDAASFDGVPRPLPELVASLAELRVSTRTVSAGMQFEHL